MTQSSRRLAAIVLGLVLVVASTGQVVRAAGTWTGLSVDGPPLEPVSGGLQHLYAPPTDSIVVAPPTTAGRAVIEVSVAGWDLRFEDRDGADLAVGTYYATTVTGENGFHGFAITGPGGGCAHGTSEFTIRELGWSGVADVSSLAIDFEHFCGLGLPALHGALRIASSLPIVGVANDPDSIVLASTTLGVPGAPTDVTITSIGQAPLTIGTAYVDGNRQGDVGIVTDECSGSSLAPGESCVISIHMSGIDPAFETQPRLIVPEDSPAGQRTIQLKGTVTTGTVTTMTVDPERSFWPGNTFVTADITPLPSSGVVTFHYDDGQGTSGQFSTDVSLQTINAQHLVPRGTYAWTATFEGQGAYLKSTSTPITRDVGLDTTTALTAASYPIAAGTTAVLRATSTGGGGAALPAGTITIRTGTGTVVGSGLVGGAVDTIEVNVPGLAIGSHQFEATYVSSDDGKTSDAGFRLAVSTGSIHEAWAAAPPPAAAPAYPTQVAATTTGVFVAGRVYGALDGQTALGQNDVYVARYSPDGDLVWARQFGTTVDDWVHSLVVSGGSLYVGYGESDRGSGPDYVPARGVVARLTMDGDLVWRRDEQHPALDPVFLAGTPDGGVAVSMNLPESDAPFPDRPLLVRSYRPDGSVAWQDIIHAGPIASGSRYTWASGVAADQGGVVATGFRLTSASNEEAFLRRYDLAGHLTWDRLVGPPDKEPRAASIASGAGGIWLGGDSKLPLLDIPNAFPDTNHFVRGYGFAGQVTYTDSFATARIVGDCSSFVTIGNAPPDPDTGVNNGAAIARWSAAGQARWRWEQAGSATGGVEYRDVAVVGTRAYLIRETYGSPPAAVPQALVALDGLPARTDCDSTSPTTRDVKNAFAAGSTVASGRPTVTFRWTGSDTGSGVARYDVAQSTDGGPYVTVASGVSGTSYVRALATRHRYRVRVRAVDLAGNVGPWAYGTTFRVSSYQETSRSIRWTGTWRTGSSDGYWGGHDRYARGAGAKASLTFTGRSFAWVGSVGPSRGWARVYVNGVLVRSINLHASTNANRRILFATTWSISRQRTVTIRITGTSGHPRGDVDAFVTGS